MTISLNETTITGLGAGGLPSATVTDATLASSLDLSSKTLTFAAGKMLDQPKYESAWVQVNQGGNYFFSHGLGRQPYLVRAYCKWDNANDNKPWVCVGDLGMFDNNSGSDYGIAGAVSNSLICLAIGEGGIANDWGASQTGFPMNDNAFETYYATYGQNGGSDFMDTPTETAGTWSSAWFKVFAW